MFTQPRDPNNKKNLPTNNIALIIPGKTIPFQAVSKKIVMTKTKEKLMPYQNLLRNHLYNTVVLPVPIKQNGIIHDFEAEQHQNIIIIPKTTT